MAFASAFSWHSIPQSLSLFLYLFLPLSVCAQPFNNNFLVYFQDDLPGQALLDVVFARLNLIETSYFGIRYIDDENQTVSGEFSRESEQVLAYPAAPALAAAAEQTYWFLKFIFVFIEIH